MAPESSESSGSSSLSSPETARSGRAGELKAVDGGVHASVLAALEEGVVVIGRAGALLQANAAASQILGIELEGLAADADWWSTLSARRSNGGGSLDVGSYVLASGHEVRDVAVEIDRDGATRSLSVNYLPLQVSAGAVDGLVLSFRDVTDAARKRERLVEAQERLREALDVARLASWEWQPETGDVLVFQALAESDLAAGTSITLDEWLAMIPASEHDSVTEDFAAYIQGTCEETARTIVHPLPDGPVWLEVRSRAVRDDDGRLLCVRGTAQNVSEREIANRELAGARDFLQATLDSLSAHVVVLDERGEIVTVNRAWREFAAENAAAVGSAEVGANYLAACDAASDVEDAVRTARGLRAISAGDAQAFSLEYECDSPVGRSWYQVRATRYEGPGPFRVVVAHEDITQRKEFELQLANSAKHLRAVTDSMGEGVYTVDAAGHATYMNRSAEDLLGWTMEKVAGRQMHALVHNRRPDGSVCPLEQCQILRAWREGEIVRVTDDIFIRPDGSELPVAYTASPFVTDEGPAGCVVVFEDITRRKAEELVIESDLDKLEWVARVEEALTGDRFVLHAQPIVSLSSGEVEQRELLIRMRQPEGSTLPGLIPPSYFLPVAEEFGQIATIDRWVIDRAAEYAAGGMPIELNVSGRSISDPRLVDYIEAAIRRTNADPRRMVFEITETTMVTNELAAKGFVERLHRLGCKVALDDFGTGYGGFTYVKQLPIDYLKIDIEFVSDLRFNPASASVIQAIVKLAQGFGLQTVAEGVEDAETMELLRALGVDHAQGYHVGRPAPLFTPVEVGVAHG